ncbi:MAG TPA: hypothetical protein VJP78_11670 [Thermoleophilia bacterium]|nr:hypothetical protein [Thermoleophilia bacterium]
MLGDWRARRKARRTCPHEWEVLKGYRFLDVEGDPALGTAQTHQRYLYVYRGKVCDKKKRVRETPVDREEPR